MDAARWRVLSPLLDELLELDEPLRQARLEYLRAADPSLADELTRLLSMGPRSDTFMAQPLVGPRKPASAPGGKVGSYRLERLLGEGGAGQVWLASHESHPEVADVALKLLRPQLADPHLRGRFQHECAIHARLSHPSIPRLREAGTDGDGQLFMALDYVPGQAISDFCRERALSLAQRVALFLQVCDVVQYAHARAVVHRDLKPSNILVDANGRVWLLDFGIARLLDEDPVGPPAATGRAFTVHYASPEQLRGEGEGVAADVYSLGVVFYELLTGRKPYRLRRHSDAEWDRAILRVDTPPPSEAVTADAGDPSVDPSRRLAQQLRGDLDAIALKALQKSCCMRYDSVEAFAQDLRRYQQCQPVHARRAAPGYRALRWLQGRHLWPRPPH